MADSPEPPLSHGHWQKVDSDVKKEYFPLLYPKNPAWLFFELEGRDRVIKDYILEVPYPNIYDIRIFVFDEKGLVFSNYSGSRYAFHQRPISDRHFVYPIDLPYKKRLRVYLYIHSLASLRLALYICDSKLFYEGKIKENIFYFTLFGLALSLILYNTIFFVRFWDKNYLIYVLYAISFVLVLFRISGFGYQYLWPSYPLIQIYSFPFLAILVSLLLNIFLQSFLGLFKGPLFTRLSSYLVYYLALPVFSVIFFLSIATAYRIILLYSGLVLVNGLILALTGLALGRRGSIMILTAFSFPLMGGILNILRFFDILPPVFAYEYLFYGSSLWELFFFSMALSDRFARLEAEKREIESRARERSLFFSAIGHDLRQPLNILLGYSQELQQNKDITLWQELLPKITSSASTLAALAEDVLEYDRLERGELALEFSLTKIDEDLFLPLREMFYNKAQSKGLTLLFESEATRPYLADKGRILRILINLVSNAVKYTEKGGILVSFREKTVRDQILGEFSIKDTGIGMSEEELKLIFKPYVRVGKYKDDPSYGAGLGLVIVKKLVELMRGELSVESERGIGSVFVFRLPLKPFPEAEGREGQTKSLKLRKILIVDDDPDQIELLTRRLGGWGLTCYSIRSLEEVASIPPDVELALIDLHLGRHDGRMVAQKLREKLPHLFVIFITGSEEILQEKAEGPTLAILQKPLSFGKLFEILQKHFS